MLGGRAVGQEIKRAAGKQSGVKLSGIEEPFQREGAVLGRAELIQVGFVDDEVLVGGILIAAGDGTGFELAVYGAAFFMADALAAAGVELVEVNLLAGGNSGIGLPGRRPG